VNTNDVRKNLSDRLEVEKDSTEESELKTSIAMIGIKALEVLDDIDMEWHVLGGVEIRPGEFHMYSPDVVDAQRNIVKRNLQELKKLLDAYLK